jgi:hypothetical protein
MLLWVRVPPHPGEYRMTGAGDDAASGASMRRRRADPRPDTTPSSATIVRVNPGAQPPDDRARGDPRATVAVGRRRARKPQGR